MDRSYKLLDKSVKNLKRMEHKSRVVSGKGKKYGKKYRVSNNFYPHKSKTYILSNTYITHSYASIPM